MLAGQRFQGRMYYGTQAGVLYLVPQTPDGAVRTHFEHVAGPSGQCWSFAPMNDPDTPGRAVLLATCSSALYAIEGTKAVTIKESKDLTFRANSALVSRLDPSRVWIGLFDGIASFRWAKGRWIDEGRVEGTDAEIRSLFENQDGSIWGGTSGSGLFRLVPASTPGPGTERPAMRIERLGEKDGLPPGGVAVVNVGGVPLLPPGPKRHGCSGTTPPDASSSAIPRSTTWSARTSPATSASWSAIRKVACI